MSSEASSRTSIEGIDGLVVASNDVFHLAWFRSAPNRANAGRLLRALQSWLAATSNPRFALFVAEDTDPPSPHALQSLAESANLVSRHGVRGGVIVLGTGFRNILIRSSIATISRLTGKGLAIVVAASADEMFERLPIEVQHRPAFDEVIAAGRKLA
jgi:hypothetical protein